MIEASLGFTRPVDVAPDDERAGLLRARTLAPPEARTPDLLDHRVCQIRDWAETSGFRPSLGRHGFDWVDLSSFGSLQEVLARVCAAAHVRAEDARAIRHALAGQTLRLGDGSRIRLLKIAPEGFIMRKAGPNGLAVSPPDAMSEMNGHDAAGAVHADQDVGGTPLRQMMRGAAPWLFHHEAPDSRNRWSPLLLLNLWIPLQQITRPLALMDRGSLDRRAHQLRYGLPTDAFLDRDEAQRVNDIWTFLYDAGQEWYFHAEMTHDRAYVFETLSTPHGSFVVPGEDVAEARYRILEAALEAVRRGDRSELARVVSLPSPPPVGRIATQPLRRAVADLEARIAEAEVHGEAFCEGRGATAWEVASTRALDAVVRKSLEMRVVALRVPRFLGAARKG